MLKTECPECGESIELREEVQVGDRVICVECGAELEILSLVPLELDYTLEDEWEDDWDEEEGEDQDPYEDDEDWEDE